MKASLKSLPLLIVLGLGCSTALANTALWQGVSGTTTTTNWSDNANWNNIGAGGLGPNGNDTVFGDNGAVGTAATINSVVDNSSLNPFSLLFTNESQATALKFHTVLIPAGVGMTNANGLTVGVNNASNGYLTVVNFVGGGTFAQNGAAMTVKNIGSTSSSGARATLDLSGLTNFVYNASGGTLTVAGSGGDARGGGTLTLANGTNVVTVGTITIATGTGNGGAGGILNLGAGTNIINVGTVNVAGGKINTATIKFGDVTGGLRLRGVGGTDADRANFLLANRNNTGTGQPVGTLDFNGHPVDVKAGTITMGQATASNPTTAGQLNSATIQFDTGTLDATTINMAINSLANVTTTSTLSVGSAGTLLIGSGGLSLVNQTAGSANGSLNITGGNVTANNSILKTSSAGTANLAMAGGSLTLAAGKTVGTSAIPIDNLQLGSAILNVSVVANSTNFVATSLNLTDTGNTVNVATLPSVGGFPTQFPLISYVSSIGGGSLNLGTLPSTFSGYVSNDTVSTVWLVITNGPFIAKADTWGGAVSYNWDTTSLNWTNTGVAVAYNEGDFVSFDDSARTNTVNLTGARTPTTLGVTNNLLNYTFSGPGSLGSALTLVKDGSASLRLAETGGDSFNGGIQLVNGTLILDDPGSTISGGLTINSGATAQIGNGDTSGTLPAGPVDLEGTLVFKRTDNITVAASLPGNGSLTQLGNGTLPLTSSNSYLGTTTVAGGTLALGSAANISSSPLLVVSNATLDLSAAAPQTALSTVNLTNSTMNVVLTNLPAPLSVSSLNVDGVVAAQNVINVLALPTVASYPASLTIVQSGGPINLVGGHFNFFVGTLPAATPAYAGSLSESADQMSIVLTLTAGPVGVRPAVYWSGADVPNLNTNWSDRLNWQLPGAPGPADNVVFYNSAVQSVSALSTPGGGSAALTPENFNNIVDSSLTVASLTYSNAIPGGNYHNTDIASGQALNVTNTLTVGAFDSGPTAVQGSVTISGSHASLNLPNTNANFQVWVGSANVGGSEATLDLSALDNFSASVSRLLVGASVNNAVNRPSGILYLAKTNNIRLGFQTTTSEAGTTTANSGIVVADCNQNAGSASFLYLGQVNTIWADTIGIGRQKASGHMLFNPTYANVAPFPSLTLQGFSSSQVSIFDISDSAGNTGTTTMTADVDLSGGRVTAAVDTLNIGRASTGGTAGTATGALRFDAGAITVNTANVGLQPTNNTKVGIGTLGVSSNAVIGTAATLVVRGSLNLGAAPAGGASAATAGTLGITNGTVLANAIAPGSGTHSTNILAGGRLVVTNAVGSLAVPLEELDLVPLGTPDNSINVLSLPVGTNASGITVSRLNLDGLDTTASILNVLSVGPVGDPPLELPLIQYGTMTLLAGTSTNVSLGTLPSGYAGYFTNDSTINAFAVVLTTVRHPVPKFVGASLQPGPSLAFGGTNGFANAPYYVLASTNVSAPLASWTSVQTNVFGPDGSFSFSTAIDPTKPGRFFVLQVP